MTEFNHILNALPWPSLLVGPDLRVGKFNSAAQSMFELAGSKTLLVNIMRHPNVLQELLARIKLQLKRTRPATMGAELQHDDLRMDTETQRVWYADREITLGRREYALLLALIEHPGKVFKRVTLLDQVWGREFDGETRTVDVHIGRLRKVLTQFGAEDVIRTVRGSGYALY
jgi:two-component system phosphate regulon response regulator PhoB